MLRFRDRTQAGRRLAESLADYAKRGDAIVLGLPRGGVPVAFEIAKTLDIPMDIFLVRKLGVPGHEELAMGAIASGGVRVLNDDVIHALGISDRAVAEVAAREQHELERRNRLYRGEQAAPDLRNKLVILTDDGLATGATMQAAVNAVRAQQPAQVVVAVPTAAPDTCDMLAQQVDRIVCLMTPEPFGGVGAWYEDFSQMTDDEVRGILEEAQAQRIGRHG